MRYCPACGSLLEAGAESCAECGARAVAVEPKPEPRSQEPAPPRPEPKGPVDVTKAVAIGAAVLVVLVGLALVFLSHRRGLREIVEQCKPALAVLMENQDRCVELDAHLRSLVPKAIADPTGDPLGSYLLDEGSLELAEIEEGLRIVDEELSGLAELSGEPLDRLGALTVAHRAFCRWILDQPDGQPESYLASSDRMIATAKVEVAAAERVIPITRSEKEDLTYPFQERIAAARDEALTYLLEEERKRSEAVFREVADADASDMEQRMRLLDEYDRTRSRIEGRAGKLEESLETDRRASPLAPRPEVAPLSDGSAPKPEELVLAANTRLWQPRLEEALRRPRALSTKLRGFLRDNRYPPEMLDDCRRLSEAVKAVPRDRLLPAPERFLEEATRALLDSLDQAAGECLEDNFFALDGNLVTAEKSWHQIQDRIEVLTRVAP